MDTPQTPEILTYDRVAIFRLIAELYFAMEDIVPSIAAPDEDMLDPVDRPVAPLVGQDIDASVPASPMLMFEDSYIELRENLFEQYLRFFTVLIDPLLTDPEGRKAFENFTLKEYGYAIRLRTPQPPKKKTKLTIVP